MSTLASAMPEFADTDAAVVAAESRFGVKPSVVPTALVRAGSDLVTVADTARLEAVELAETLTLVRDWLDLSHPTIRASLDEFVGADGYADEILDDLHRAVALIGA